ncbi:MAG TPA: ATPase, T2SS/T4P/T4SS family, partial [Gammaproteobacteria bacterium]|nr:ATPase, T2SS/T4P/T4SS family [Gammaproteobacteria bacterium]
MATPNVKVPLSGLGRRLVQDGLVNEAQVQEANEASVKEKVPFVSYLVQKKAATSRDIASAAALEFGVPLMDLGTMELDPEVVKLVEEKLIRKHHALPLFKRGNRLFVGVSDPTNLQGLDEIKFHVGINTEAILVEDDKLAQYIDRAMEANDSTFADLSDGDLDDVDFADEDQMEGGGPAVSESEVDDTPVVRFINKVLLDAINRGASDIHFEPYEKNYRVRTRLDGMLSEVASPPVGLGPKLTARLKVMARLDISERRIPQDGR